MKFSFSDKAYHIRETLDLLTDKLLEGLSRDVLSFLHGKGYPIRVTHHNVAERAIKLTFDTRGLPWEEFRNQVFRDLDLYLEGAPDEEVFEWGGGNDTDAGTGWIEIRIGPYE